MVAPSEYAAAAEPTPDRREVWWLALLMLVGTSVAVVAAYVQGVYRKQPYPFNTFLYKPGDEFQLRPGTIGIHHFGDLQATLIQSADPSPYLSTEIFPSNYLAFTHLLLRPLAELPYPYALGIFLIGMTVSLLALVGSQLEGLDLPARLVATVVVALLNYPVLVMLDRGNVEGLLLLLLAAAALCARRGAWTASAVLIGVAAAMKGYPVVFALVLVGHRRYRESLISIGTAVVLTVVSLATFSGGWLANAREMIRSVRSFNAVNAGDTGERFGSSLKGLTVAAAHTEPSLGWLRAVVAPVSVGVVILGLVAVLSGRLLLWQSFAVLAGLTILIPSVAYDYRLVLLMAPLLLFLRDPGGRLRWLTVVLLGLLFIPKAVPVLYEEVNIGVILSPLFLLVLVVGLSFAALLQPPPETVR